MTPEDKSKPPRITGSRPTALLDGRVILSRIYGPPGIYADSVDLETGMGRTLVTPDRASRRYQFALDNQYLVDATTAEVGITILPEHSEDHFPPASGLPLIIHAHKGLRLAAAALSTIVDFNTLSPDGAAAGRKSYTRIAGFEQAAFKRPIKPGDEVIIKANLTGQPQVDKQGQPTIFTGNASLFVGTELKSEFLGLIIKKQLNLKLSLSWKIRFLKQQHSPMS